MSNVVATETLPDLLNKAAHEYVTIFESAFLPIVVDLANYNPEGQVTANVALDNENHMKVTMGFDYANKFPEPFEIAQRIIFSEVFAVVLTAFGKYTQTK